MVCVCVCGVVVKKVGPSRGELSAFWPWRCEIFARLLRTLTGLLRRFSDSRVLRFSKNFGTRPEKFLPGSTKSSAAQSGRHTALTRLPPHARLTRIGNFSNVRAHLLQPLLRPATSRSHARSRSWRRTLPHRGRKVIIAYSEIYSPAIKLAAALGSSPSGAHGFG